MKKKSISSFIILTFFAAVSYSQSVSFLNTPSDARSAAMGNAGYLLASPFSVQYNSASVMAESLLQTGVGVSALFWQPREAGATLFNVAGFHKIKKFGFLAGFRSNKTGDIAKSDANGNITGSFSPFEYAFEIGMGYDVSTNVSLGISLRHLSSQMDQNIKSSALASDISMLYHHGNLRLGLGISNLGSKIDYGNTKYSLPARIKSGIAYHLTLSNDQALITVADLFYQLTPDYSGVASGLGVEYNYKKLIALRTGYHFESKSVGASYATIGLGTKFSGLSLDLAYLIAQENNPMRQTLLFSLKWEK